jgi:hypothetical protein
MPQSYPPKRSFVAKQKKFALEYLPIPRQPWKNEIRKYLSSVRNSFDCPTRDRVEETHDESTAGFNFSSALFALILSY